MEQYKDILTEKDLVGIEFTIDHFVGETPRKIIEVKGNQVHTIPRYTGNTTKEFLSIFNYKRNDSGGTCT